MRFGVREICDVVLRRKAAGFFGKLYLDKDMPVLYFDTLKTSSLEGQSTTVYAQGGKGNPRLVAWEGDRTVTFTMEDALISPESFSILSGAGFMDADEDHPIFVHTTEQVQIKGKDETGAAVEGGQITLSHEPAKAGGMFIMLKNEDGSINTNRIPMEIKKEDIAKVMKLSEIFGNWADDYNAKHAELLAAGKIMTAHAPKATDDQTILDAYKDAKNADEIVDYVDGTNEDYPGSVLYVDYYVKSTQYVKQIDIEAGKFGGSYYLEASTLFRDESTGEDYPAEFIIPNCKVQSNFTFTMAPTGDPSTFTFTMDAFPDYTKFDKTKKVIAALQIVEDKELYDGSTRGGEIGEPLYAGDIYEDSGKEPPKRFEQGN
jgi:hypothetical protein